MPTVPDDRELDELVKAKRRLDGARLLASEAADGFAEAIHNAHNAGKSYAEIGGAVGLSKQRVHDLATAANARILAKTR